MGSELSSRPTSRASRARRKRDSPKRLVGRPKLQSQDSRPCSTRLSEATEDSLPCSTRRSEFSEPDPQALFEELTGELSSLAEAPEVDTRESWLPNVPLEAHAHPEVSLEEALEEQHQMPGRSNTKEELRHAREELDREREALRREKEAFEAQLAMDVEITQEHVSRIPTDDLQEVLEEAEHMMEAETVQEHVSSTQPEALWVPHISAESEGLVYYHNVRTDEVTWEMPAPEALQVTEWVMHMSPEGKPYFFNEITLETSWELVPGGIVVGDETSDNPAEFAKASDSTWAPNAESTLSRNPVLEAPTGNPLWEAPTGNPLWEAPPPIQPRRAEAPPRIDQGAIVRTKRMDAGFEKWAMSLCMEIAPRGGEAGGPPPANKASLGAPMMPPPG